MRNVVPLVGGTNQKHNWDKGWGRKLVPCNLRMPPSFKGENDLYQHVLLSMFSGSIHIHYFHFDFRKSNQPTIGMFHSHQYHLLCVLLVELKHCVVDV